MSYGKIKRKDVIQIIRNKYPVRIADLLLSQRGFFVIVHKLKVLLIVHFDKVRYFFEKWCYFFLFTTLYLYKTNFILRKSNYGSERNRTTKNKR